jgi:short subunit dehydrogenase-like uncharacterized protein
MAGERRAHDGPGAGHQIEYTGGQAGSVDGRTVSATMSTPNAYDLTVTAGLGIVEFLLENQVEGGYYTPSLLMGAGYAASLPGVEFSLIS